MKLFNLMFLLFFGFMVFGQETITKVSDAPGENSSKMIKNKGFFSETLLGGNFGNSTYGNRTGGFAFGSTAGYQFGNVALGIGVGLESWFEAFALPTYLTGRYYFSKSKTAPFLALNGGYCFGGKTNQDQMIYYDYYYPVQNTVNGAFGSAHFGVRRALADDFAIVLSTGARYQYSQSEYFSYYANQKVKEVFEYYRFEIRVGVFFN